MGCVPGEQLLFREPAFTFLLAADLGRSGALVYRYARAWMVAFLSPGLFSSVRDPVGARELPSYLLLLPWSLL